MNQPGAAAPFPVPRAAPALPQPAGEPAPLCGPWRWLQTLPGAADSPAVLDDTAGWLPAPVPGSVATAMRAAGRWDEGAPSPLHRHDYWYRLRFAGHGRRLLRLRGLDGAAEAWINGRLVIGAGHAPDICDAEIELCGANTLDLCFRAPRPRMHAGRAALVWRGGTPAPSMPSTQVIGYVARALPLYAVGPRQPVELLALAPPGDALCAGTAIAAVATSNTIAITTSIATTLDGDTGSLTLTVRVSADVVAQGRFEVIGGARPVSGQLTPAGPGALAGTVRVSNPQPWWPHTHGEAFLYRVRAHVAGQTVECGLAGFRAVTFPKVAPRHAGWCDHVAPSRARPAQGVRVNGVPVFCRGVLLDVQDLPQVADMQAAGRWLAHARDAGLNLVVVDDDPACRPGEGFYRACDALGMLVWRAPAALADVASTVASAAASTASPTVASTLAPIAAVPCPRTLAEAGPATSPRDPRWKAGIPRQAGHAWDAEDLRDRYLRARYGVDPPQLRREAPQRYLMLSRALAADMLADAAAAAVRSAARLLLLPRLRDPLPGCGTGLVDACGRPKSGWHAVRQHCGPVQAVFVTDAAGMPVLALRNETGSALAVVLDLCSVGNGQAVTARRALRLSLRGRSVRRVAMAALALPAAAGTILLATLADAASGERLAEATWLPPGSVPTLPAAGLHAVLRGGPQAWSLEVSATCFAHRVHIDDRAWRAAHDWFDLAPGATRHIRLMHDGPARAGAGLMPIGEVQAMNQPSPVRYG